MAEKPQSPDSKTGQLLRRFRATKDALGITTQALMADLNASYLPEGDPVSYAAVCNWLSGKKNGISSRGVFAVTEWLQKNEQKQKPKK